MVSLDVIESSNARIASTFSPGLVAIFVGGTNGIGETTLRQFAKYAPQPRVYFIGRSQEAGDRIAAECKSLNAGGQFNFIQADTSLIRNVDEICRDLMSKEKSINLLFLTTGTLIQDVGWLTVIPGAETAEGLNLCAALGVYSRTRFIVNLLPLLQKATGLRRVVTVFTATKEGPVDTGNFQGWKLSLMQARAHASTITTLSLETLCHKAPDMSFIHNFPGSVKGGATRGTTGPVFFAIKAVAKILGPFVFTPLEEAGDRHLYLATSQKYPARESEKEGASVPLGEGVEIARGTDGKSGSGVYSIDAQGESAGPKVEELLAKFRTEGLVGKLWKHIEGEFTRITGKEAA